MIYSVRNKVFFLSIFFMLQFAIFAGNNLEVKTEKKGINYATPLQLSFYAPIQLAPEDSSVYGVRAVFLYGVNYKIYGFDLGVWNQTMGNQYGLQIAALVAYRKGKTCGLNIAGIANLSENKEYGASIAGIYNNANGRITGLQAAGCFAKANHVRGLQLSLINYCDDLTGLQIGLINICSKSSIPFMFLINAKY